MTDRSKFEEMLERLVNEDRAGAEELFHEIVVEKSREIYQDILESDYEDDEEVDEAAEEDEDDEAVDEAEEDDGDELEEMFGLDDGYEMEAPMGGDATDDMMGDVAADDGMGDDDMGELGDDDGMGGDTDARIQDLEDALEDLKAEFDRLMAGEENEPEHDDMFSGDEEGEDEEGEEEKESFAFEAKKDAKKDDKKTKKSSAEEMREYVEKIGGSHYNQYGKMGDNGVNTKSAVAGKNDMGGTTQNILRTDVEKGVEANKGQLQGNGVFKGTAKDMNTKNVNVPGGKAGVKHLKSQPKGHGAEKKGAGETADKGAVSTLTKLSSRAK